MLRFAGILTGSGLAIALILVTMGAPRFAAPPVTASETPLPQPAAESPVVAAATPATTTPGTDGEQPGRPPQQATPEPPPPVVDEKLPDPLPAIADAATRPAPRPETPPGQPEAENWYAFWSPFRSEIAADGFVARLQQTTGLDYRVVKLEPGVYEVAFAYSSDSDRADKLQRISAATGLDLTGG